MTVDSANALLSRVQKRSFGSSSEALRTALSQEVSQLSFGHGGAVGLAGADDVLGDVYERLLAPVDRRAAGQFMTPAWAADLMGGWLRAEPMRTLLDPAVGSGRLLYRTAASASGCPTLVGIDSDPLCIQMAEANLRLRGLGAVLTTADFLLDHDASAAILPGGRAPDAVVVNPPFVRSAAMPPDFLHAVRARLLERLGVRLNGNASAHVLFLLRALEVAAPGARLAFLTPCGWLDAGYSTPVRQFLDRRAHIDAIVRLHPATCLFPAARTSAAITLLRNAPCSSPTRLVRLPPRLPAVEHVLAVIAGERPGSGAGWTVSSKANGARRTPRVAAHGVRLSDVAEVCRGIATGANEFFVLSEQRRLALGLAVEQLTSCLPRPRLLSGLEVEEEDLAALSLTVPRWLVRASAAEREDGPTALAAYLRWGRERGMCNGYLVAQRRRWFAVATGASAPIVFPYVHQRGVPRFLRNRTSALALNTYLLVRPREGVDADALWAALNAPAFIRRLRVTGRELGNEAWKVEPGVLAKLYLRTDLSASAPSTAEPAPALATRKDVALATSGRTSCEASADNARASLDVRDVASGMTASARIYQASDLNQCGRAILDAARVSVARVRDKDGTSLVMLSEEQLQVLSESADDLVQLGDAVASYVTLQRAVAQLDSRPGSLPEYGVFVWARALSAQQLAEFVGELGDALLLCGRERALAPLADTVTAWRAVAASGG
jgi:adenine-specific DNA-methyltransferase